MCERRTGRLHVSMHHRPPADERHDPRTPLGGGCGAGTQGVSAAPGVGTRRGRSPVVRVVRATAAVSKNGTRHPVSRCSQPSSSSVRIAPLRQRVRLLSASMGERDAHKAPYSALPRLSRPPNGIALMNTATNPCAALLFVDYELSGGQKVVEEGFRVAASAEAAKVLDGLEVAPVPEDEMLDNGKKWDALYAEVTSPQPPASSSRGARRSRAGRQRRA
jgi:hypothetical protein